MDQNEIRYSILFHRSVFPVKLGYCLALFCLESVSLAFHFISLYLFLAVRSIYIDKKVYFPLGKLTVLTGLQTMALQLVWPQMKLANIQQIGSINLFSTMDLAYFGMESNGLSRY